MMKRRRKAAFLVIRPTARSDGERMNLIRSPAKRADDVPMMKTPPPGGVFLSEPACAEEKGVVIAIECK
jgi:hypothetical protein